jgi:hypothetical protein
MEIKDLFVLNILFFIAQGEKDWETSNKKNHELQYPDLVIIQTLWLISK